MKKTDRKKLYHAAVEKWGYGLQLVILMEECAELTQAASKIFRTGIKSMRSESYDNLVEEIADVEICIEQIKSCTDWENLAERVEIAKQKKLEKFKNIIGDL